jgi:hypothetical protein
MTSSARLQHEADAARAGLSSALEDLRHSVTTTAITNGAMTFAKEGSNAVATRWRALPSTAPWRVRSRR